MHLQCLNGMIIAQQNEMNKVKKSDSLNQKEQAALSFV